MIVTENYTNLSNQFLDLLPEMKSSVLQIMLAFLYESFRLNQDYAFMSYTEFEIATGLKHNTISYAVQEAVEKKYLAIIPEVKGFNGKTCYMLGEKLGNFEIPDVLKPKFPDISEYPQTGQYVYLIEGAYGYYKIGKTSRPQKRIRSLSVVLPFDIEVIHLIPTNDMSRAEKQLHAQYEDKRIRGEWFALTDFDVEEIKQIESIEVSL